MGPFSGINCVLFRETGVHWLSEYFWKRKSRNGNRKSVLVLPDIPSQSVHGISLVKMVLVTLLHKRQ